MSVSIIPVCTSACVMSACDTNYTKSLPDRGPGPIRRETTPQSGASTNESNINEGERQPGEAGNLVIRSKLYD